MIYMLIACLLVFAKYSSTAVINYSNRSEVDSGNITDINTQDQVYVEEEKKYSIKLSEEVDSESGDISDYVTNVDDFSEASEDVRHNKNKWIKNENETIRNSEDHHKTILNTQDGPPFETVKVSSNARLVQTSVNADLNNLPTTPQDQTVTYVKDFREVDTSVNESAQNFPQVSNFLDLYESQFRIFNQTHITSNMSYIKNYLQQPTMNNLLSYINYSSNSTRQPFSEEEKVSSAQNIPKKAISVNSTTLPEILNNDTSKETYGKDVELTPADRRLHRRHKHNHMPKRVVRDHISSINFPTGINLNPDFADQHQNDDAAFHGQGSYVSDIRESLQNTKDILRQWLESSIIDFSHNQNEFDESDEGWGVMYDDHHSHEWHNDYDVIDEMFNQDWFLSSDELSERSVSDENEYFACVANDLWEHFVSFAQRIYKGCEFVSEIEQMGLGFRGRRFISRAPGGRASRKLKAQKCKHGTRSVKKVCKKVWYS